MTPKEADRLIASGQEVQLVNTRYNEAFRAIIVSRTRYTVRTAAGGVFDRSDLQIDCK